MMRTGVFSWTVAAMLATAAPALAQTLGQGEDTDVPWLRLGAAMLLCIGLAVGGTFALRRRLGVSGGPTVPALEQLMRGWPGAGGERSAPRVTDIETRRLSPQVTVSVFRCDGRSFLVTASAQGQLLLVSLDETPGEST